MSMLDHLKMQLLRDEGLKLHPYQDTEGKLTIGVGRNLNDAGITEQEAYFLLDNDMATAYATLIQHFPWVVTLDEARQGVLTNMCFNMGIYRLSEFKNTFSFIHLGDFERASEEMLNSAWAHQVGARAQRLALQMKTGQWV